MPVRGLRAGAYVKGEVVFDNSFESSDWAPLLPEGHAPLHNVMFAPLDCSGEGRRHPRAGEQAGRFDEADARMALAFGQLAALALQSTRAEAAVKERERLLRHITDNMFDMVSLADLEGRFLYASPSHRQLGYEPEALVGRSVIELVHADDMRTVLEEVAETAPGSPAGSSTAAGAQTAPSSCWSPSARCSWMNRALRAA